MAHSATATAQPCSCRRHFSSAGRLSLARAARKVSHPEAILRIEVRRVASQTIRRSLRSHQRRFALAANDDFAEVMFMGA